MAVGAQATEPAEPERGEVAFVRLDMVGDGRRHDAPSFQAKLTQWLDLQLVPSAALPTCGCSTSDELPDDVAFAVGSRGDLVHQYRRAWHANKGINPISPGEFMSGLKQIP